MFQELISRADAQARGLKHYFTGRPCKLGHVEPRLVSSRDCMECNRMKSLRSHWGNRDAVLEKKRQHHRDNPEIRRRHYQANQDKARAYASQYRKANPDIIRAQLAKRRAMRIERTPSWYGEVDDLVLLEAVDLVRRREAATGIEWHIDHMIPMQGEEASGLHCAANLQVIPAALNVSKQNRMIYTEPGEWIAAL